MREAVLHESNVQNQQQNINNALNSNINQQNRINQGQPHHINLHGVTNIFTTVKPNKLFMTIKGQKIFNIVKNSTAQVD